MTPSQLQSLKQHIKGLVLYFKEQGFDLKPYPKITFSKDNNSDDILDKTGYYNPDENAVVIYINGRSPKDCLRTCSHEFIHVLQGHRGDLDQDKIGPVSDDYTQGSEHLKEMEDEAYLLGNTLMRGYTEKLKSSL